MPSTFWPTPKLGSVTASVRDLAAEDAADPRADAAPSSSPSADRRSRNLLFALLAAALILPLAVAVFAFHKPTWAPVLDLAQTELRVRDVGTSHTPLIGLPGRIGSGARQGSHP